MTYSIHSSSSTVHHHHNSATFSDETCSTIKSPISLKRKKALSPLSSEPSTKRVTHNSPPPSTTTNAMSPVTAFSPLSKRVSYKSPFSTTNTASAMAAVPPPPLPFSRFIKTNLNSNNKTLRRTLSEPPVFDSFTAFCRYINSQPPENAKNNSISVKSRPLRRSISDPTAADIILAHPLASGPSLSSEEATQNKRVLKEFLNEEHDADDKDDTASDNQENNSNNSQKS